MKLGIIVFQNLKYAPFLDYYTNFLKNEKDIEYEIIYYNRDRNLREPYNDKYIPIRWIGKGTNAAPKYEKAINFLFYKNQLEALLKKKRYDKLLIIMTMPSILISNYLIKNYKNKYIIDIRDYTYESLIPYYRREELVLKNSCLNIISSDGFKTFLPKNNYEICHNYNIKGVSPFKFEKKKNTPIIISYIGSISYEDQCIKLIKLVEKDNRFEFHFFGNENTSHQVSEYIKINKCKKCFIHGPFKPSEKQNIYGQSDIVFNCYGNKDTLVKYAISNKYYDGAYYKKPVISSPNTIMSQLAGNYGFALDLDSVSSLDGLFDWYKQMNEKEYEEYANSIIEKANIENNETKEIILKTIREMN